MMQCSANGGWFVGRDTTPQSARSFSGRAARRIAIEANGCGKAFLEARRLLPKSCSELAGIDVVRPIGLKPHFDQLAEFRHGDPEDRLQPLGKHRDMDNN